MENKQLQLGDIQVSFDVVEAAINAPLWAPKQVPGSVMVIRDQATFLRLRKRWLPGNGPSIYSLVLGEDGKYMVCVKPGRENPFNKTVLMGSAFVVDGVSTRRVECFTRKYISLDVDPKRAHQFIKGIWVFDDERGHVDAYVIAGAGKYVSLLTGEKSEQLPAGCRKYLVHFPSPASLRTQTLMFHEVTTDKDMKESEELANQVTTGAYRLMRGESVTQAKGAKCDVRLSGAHAPSKNWGVIPGYALTDDLFADGENDGTIYMRASFAASVLGRTENCVIYADALEGICLQARPSGVIKAQIVIVSDEFFELLLAKYPHLKYGEGSPVLIFDNNAMKANFKFGDPINLEVLDIAQHGVAHLSIQVLQKLQPNIDKARFMEFIKACYQEEVARVLDPVAENRPTVLGFKPYQNAGSTPAAQWTNSKAPRMSLSSIDLFNPIVADGMKQQLVNIANRFYYERNSGGYVRLQNDPGALFDCNLIPFGFVFIPGKRGRKLRGQKIAIFKYPTVGCGEYYLAIVLCDEDMRDIIGASELDNPTRRALVRYFDRLQDGAMVLPSCWEIKNLLAGCDFDWDGALYIADEEAEEGCSLVRLLQECRQLLVNIKSGVKAVDNLVVGRYTLELTPRLTFQVLRRQSAGSTVGKITRMNDVVVSLMTAEFDVAKTTLTRVMGNMPTQEYVGLEYYQHTIDGIVLDAVDVRPDDVQRIAKEIHASHITPESLPKILKDLNVIFRLLQEMTIDSVKTGVVVELPFDFLKVAECEYHHGIDIKYDRRSEGAQFKLVRN